MQSTVGGARSPSNLVSLLATRAGLVASPAVTGKSIQSLLRAWTEQTYLIYGIKLLYVIRPAEYPEPLYV